MRLLYRITNTSNCSIQKVSLILRHINKFIMNNLISSLLFILRWNHHACGIRHTLSHICLSINYLNIFARLNTRQMLISRALPLNDGSIYMGMKILSLVKLKTSLRSNWLLQGLWNRCYSSERCATSTYDNFYIHLSSLPRSNWRRSVIIWKIKKNLLNSLEFSYLSSIWIVRFFNNYWSGQWWWCIALDTHNTHRYVFDLTNHPTVVMR